MAPALTAAPISSAMLCLRCRTSAADMMMMNAGRTTFACFLPAGNTATSEDAAAAASLEAALHFCLLLLWELLSKSFFCACCKLRQCRSREGARQPKTLL